ncbi:cupin domain-containing protein [Zooshikella ganghwensis]|uniref:cupin domain-containing protein n=1 Tax=Zooshikella ganghwensis TaxID=202772 RepID=UPI000419710F|nr:cupin domain-containing protein [Zooshikella ganghwensis]
MATGNIFQAIPQDIPQELFEVILEKPGVTIERIISKGHTTPKGAWYDQNNDEWVLLLQGEARVVFQGESEPYTLAVGDYLYIPAHVKHRVDWTSRTTETVWLAIHIVVDSLEDSLLK